MNLPNVILAIAYFFIGLTQAQAGEEQARIVYEQPTTKLEADIADKLKTSDALASVVSLINETFILPEQLDIVFGADDGPLYDPQIHKIFIPYEFMDEVESRFTEAKYAETGVTPDEATSDALMHTLFHELAHALIDLHEIPVTGKEEDAADSLASMLLIEFFEDGQEIALSAADLFDLESTDRDEFSDEDFWDEHSLDEQRYFSTLCHVYGSDPKQYGDIKQQADFSQERADSCIEEYGTMVDSWLTLLKPHMKPDAQEPTHATQS